MWLLPYGRKDENTQLTLPFSNNIQVTGGSSGIGKCIAIECYKQGAFITLIARDEVCVCVFLLAKLCSQNPYRWGVILELIIIHSFFSVYFKGILSISD